jgi:hypothetical protein
LSRRGLSFTCVPYAARESDGYRLRALCDVESTAVTMDGIVRILRQEAA